MVESIWFRENVTAEEWEAFAEKCDAQARETEQDKIRIWNEDGYTFYHGAIIDKYHRMANLARNYGVDWVYGLVDLDGNLVDAEIVNGKYGQVWLIRKSPNVIEWVNVSTASSVAKEQKFYASKGYQMVEVYYRFCEYKGQFKPVFNEAPIRIEVCK